MAPPVLVVGDLRIDVDGHVASVGGNHLELSPREFALLTVLARDAGRVVTHRTMIGEVWGDDDRPTLNALRLQVFGLRRALGQGPDTPRILTEPGVGYRMMTRGPRVTY